MTISGSLITKIGTSLFVAGSGIGIAIWQIGFNNSPKEAVSKYLEKRKRILASSDEDGEGLKTFYSKESSSHPIPNIAKSGITKESIRDGCEGELKKPTESQKKSHLLLVEAWCSKPQKLSDLLPSLYKTKLSVDGVHDNGVGEQYEREYKESKNTLKIQKQGGSSELWEDFDHTTITKQILQSGCKGHEDSHYKYEEDPLFDLDRYLHGCSK